MAIFDAMFELSDNQAITTTAPATNVIDFTQADLEMGAGEPLWLNVKVGTTFGGGTNVTVALVYDTATPIDASSTVIYQTPAITSLTAGDWLIRMPLPYNVDEERYVSLYYTVTGTYTAGNLDAWLDHGPQSSFNTQVTTSNI